MSRAAAPGGPPGALGGQPGGTSGHQDAWGSGYFSGPPILVPRAFPSSFSLNLSSFVFSNEYIGDLQATGWTAEMSHVHFRRSRRSTTFRLGGYLSGYFS